MGCGWAADGRGLAQKPHCSTQGLLTSPTAPHGRFINETFMNKNIARTLLEEHDDFADAQHLVNVQGLSSPRVCNFLNQLVSKMPAEECYLEIGTWKGLTTCSAAHGNAGKVCVANDKFRFWGEWTGPGFLARRAFYRNVRRYREGSAEIQMHPMTSARFFAKRTPPKPVGVYFYDGDHSYEGTFDGIVKAAPWLSETSVVLVDDWIDPQIQSATKAGFSRSGLKVEWERVLGGDQHNNPDGWWNGLGVFVVTKN
jgi:hypothetical protein